MGTLELELEAAVSLTIGMKLGSSVNAVQALNHWAISLSQGLDSLGQVAQMGHWGTDLEDCMHFVVLVQALCFLIRCDARGISRLQLECSFPAKICIPWISKQTKPIPLMATSVIYLVVAMRPVTNTVSLI